MNIKKKLRLKLLPLPERKSAVAEKDENKDVKKKWGEKGDKCERSCDCRYGLICENEICTDEW